ncbi:hypothetical protein LEN26_021057 [Aphanomyces euteiches]|nr:hypothetical protein LEN26_021057 [Aphanomyces euteiches]
MSPNSSKSQPTLLTGSANYLEWKMETSIYIAGKGLEGHLDGSIQEPLEDTIAADGSEMVKVANKASDAWRKWRMDDMKCMSKIRERVSKPILNSIGAVVNTAFDLFNILAQRYGKALGFTRLLAMNAIHQCTMRPDKSVTVHFGNVTGLIDMARLYGCKITCEDEAWFLLLHVDTKFTSASLFKEITSEFTAADVENLKMRIEDDERRLAEQSTLKRRPSQPIQGRDSVLAVTPSPDCPSTEKFDEEGKPKQNRRHSFPKKKKKATVVEAVDTEHVHFALAVRGKKDLSGWYGDSGSTVHVCSPLHRSLLHDVVDLDESRGVQGFGSSGSKTTHLSSTCKGNLVVKTKNGTRTIHDVHYFPDSNVSLLSLVVFNQRGFDFKTAGVKQLVVTKGNKEVLSFQRNGPLYQLEGVCVPPDRVLAVADIDVWHRRMGHASAAKLHQLSQSGFAMPNLKGQTLGACSVCMESNLRRQSFNKEKEQEDLRDTVSVDLIFFGVTSRDGYTCAFNLVTHTHRLSYVVPLKHKSEALAAFKPFFQYYKTQQDTSIKHVKCDGGGEFAGQFKTFLDEQGVELHVTPRATPQLNGVAERTGGLLVGRTQVRRLSPQPPSSYLPARQNAN